MNVVLIGARGGTARRAAALLAADASVDELVVVDASMGAAQRLAERAGPKAVALPTALGDAHELHTAMVGMDVAVGCVQPHPQLERRLAEAALGAGIRYVSSCDDWRATRSIFELDDAAREAGLLFVTGVAASPGLTGILARHAAGMLDGAEEIRIGWVGSTATPEGRGALIHGARSFLGRALVYENGAWAMARAGSRRERAFFPEPLGAAEVALCTHPEAFTLPRSIEGLKSVSVKGSLGGSWLRDAVGLAARVGAVAERLARIEEEWTANASAPGGIFGDRLPWGGVRVEVRGRSAGRPATRVLAAVDLMPSLAGTTLAIAAMWLGSGKLDGAGVCAAEALVEPTEFLGELAKHGVTAAVLEPVGAAA